MTWIMLKTIRNVTGWVKLGKLIAHFHSDSRGLPAVFKVVEIHVW